MFVCLNRFVTFRMYGDENVNVAHFVLFSVFLVVVVHGQNHFKFR